MVVASDQGTGSELQVVLPGAVRPLAVPTVNGPFLVTGAAGFAGSYVVEALAGYANTVGWTHLAPPPDDVAPLAEWQRVDLLNPAEVREAIARIKPSAVIHCAGAPNVAHAWRDTVTPLSVNVL